MSETVDKPNRGVSFGRRILWSMFTICALLLCAPLLLQYAWSDRRTDVTGQKEFWGGFRPGELYTLQQDLYVGNSAYLAEPREPPIASFAAAPEKWPHLAILPKGTQIEITKIVRVQHLEYSYVEVLGKPTSGTFSSKELNLDSVSFPSAMGAITRRPNPACLRF